MNVTNTITDANGKTVTRYLGEGTIMRVTTDGTYIPDRIIILDGVPQSWVIGKNISIGSGFSEGIISIAVGIAIVRWSSLSRTK